MHTAIELKELLKSLLPQIFVDSIRTTRAKSKLRTHQPMPFPIERLADSKSIDINEILNNPICKSDWSVVSPIIDRLLPANEVDWAVSPGDRRALFYLVRALRPRFILEIGTHIGGSSLHLAAALRLLRIEEPEVPRKLITVDIVDVNDPVHGAWQSLRLPRSPREMMELYGVTELVEFLTKPALEYLQETNNLFDFIFLDGSHDAIDVYREIIFATNLLYPGGVILLHDFYPNNKPLYPNLSTLPGPYLAVERLKRERAPILEIPLGNLPWLAKCGTNKTSLCLVAGSRM